MARRDPLVEYKRESFNLFEDLWDRAQEEMVRMLFLLHPVSAEEEGELLGARARRQQRLSYSGAEEAVAAGGALGRRPLERSRYSYCRRGQDRGAQYAQSGPQRTLSLRFRQEI